MKTLSRAAFTVSLSLLTLLLMSHFAHATPGTEENAATEVTLHRFSNQRTGKVIPLEKVKISIELAGPTTHTQWTLQFRNPGKFEIEGKLEVSLRKGCQVVDYAMEIDGAMRPASVVELKQARLAYEEIVSKKIDPSIVEVTKTGFSTKIYPLPPNQGKSIRIDLAEIRPDSTWAPPIPQKQKQPKNKILAVNWTILCHDLIAPTIEGLKTTKGNPITWKKENNRWITSGHNTLQELSHLKLTPVDAPSSSTDKQRPPSVQPWVVSPAIAREDRIPPEKSSAAPSTVIPIRYALGKIALHTTTQTRTRPTQLDLWWDGSLAGRERNCKATLKSIQSLLDYIQNGKVKLHVFRDKPMASTSFTITGGTCDGLIELLSKEPADGMARFNQFSQNRQNTNTTQNTPQKTHASTMTLVVSEGITALPSDLGKSPAFPKGTTWCLLDPSGQGGGILGLHAIESGQEVRSLADSDWTVQLLPPTPPFFQPTPNTPKQSEKQGSSPWKSWNISRQRNDWIITGKLDQASSYLAEIPVSPIVHPLWAQKTYHHLQHTQRSPKETLTFAIRERVLTPQTAMIVLDRLADYLQYNIEPPRGLIRQKWLTEIKTRKINQVKTLDDWTQQWNTWRNNYISQPSDYGNQLANGMKKNAAFWSGYIGYGKHRIHPDEMAVLTHLQAETDTLVSNPKSPDHLKQLIDLQSEWQTLKQKTGQRIRMIHVSIGGFVRRPGRYNLPMKATLMAAILKAGGATPFGATRRTAVYRNGRRTVFDLRKDSAKNYPLLDQDTINVPQKMWMGDGGGTHGETPPFEGNGKKNWLSHTITPGEWSPARPYAKILHAVIQAKGDWKLIYRLQSKIYGWRADYYLDVIDILEHQPNQDLRADACRIAQNLAQLDTSSPELLRRAARALNRLGDTETAGRLFTRITTMDPETPASWIDLARWHHQQKQNKHAIECYAHVTERDWPPHYHSAWTTAMVELNGLLNSQGKHLAHAIVASDRTTPLSADLRVVIDWDAARSNVDLWVDEPLDSLDSWGHQNSDTGGQILANAIAGYGPEEYLFKHAIPGDYDFKAKFHGDWNHDGISTVTLEARIITDFGRPTEKTIHTAIRLPEQTLLEIGNIKWSPSPTPSPIQPEK